MNNKKNRIIDNPFDFLGKIEDKGIFSTGKKKPKKQNSSKSGIGGILQKVFEEIANAESRIEEESKKHMPPPPPEKKNPQTKKEFRKQTAGEQQQNFKNFHTESKSKQQHSDINNTLDKKKSKKCYAKQLKHNKKALKNAFIASEIISKPVSIR